MDLTTPYVLRIACSSGTSVRSFLTAAEAYDEAATLRRALRGAGSRLQVEDVTTGAILGQWHHDGACWLLCDFDGWTPHREAPHAG